MTEVAIIDYKMSNLFSVKSACRKVGLKSVLTSDKSQILDSKIAILPGVGSFGEAMSQLSKNKLDEVIYQFIDSNKPFIGICLGLQLLFESSQEFGPRSGLGVIKGDVKKFLMEKKSDIKYPVPQIGWNKIIKEKSWESSYLKKNKDGDFMYFVHSFYIQPEDKNIILSTTEYGNNKYCSSIKYKNIFATQFHPEKSGDLGLQMYKQIKKSEI
ncbi:imidazole glycerol phosphate synthase subunit HisH [Candidatus Marinimicrobia bacterium]|jgi:imidazole glycerol-phosphate synthase subunit HisH|nr:imidazole glycerol phosphate synthase subunit HisH [Candidatus Neomarinimicrobiota bacterium]